jgi:hypothetical protein
MTIVKKQAAIDAGGFVDEVLNDILSASDAEILEDDSELTDISGETADAFVQRAVRASMTALGKQRFAEAAAELRQSRKQPRIVSSPPGEERTKRDYVESLKAAETKLSLAARGATKVSKSDLDSAIEDLNELGGMQKHPRKK